MPYIVLSILCINVFSPSYCLLFLDIARYIKKNLTKISLM